MALECFKDSRTKIISYKLPNGQGSVVVNAPICLKSQWLNYEAMLFKYLKRITNIPEGDICLTIAWT